MRKCVERSGARQWFALSSLKALPAHSNGYFCEYVTGVEKSERDSMTVGVQGTVAAQGFHRGFGAAVGSRRHLEGFGFDAFALQHQTLALNPRQQRFSCL